MTIIAAARSHGETWIGCDTIGSYGNITMDHGTKLQRGPFGVVGFSGSYRASQIFKSAVKAHKHVRTQREAILFANALREVLAGDGWAGSKEGDLPECASMLCLVASSENGSLWSIHSDFCAMPLKKFGAIGSGSEVALGAMHALLPWGSELAVRRSVRAAIDLVSGCGGSVKVSMAWSEEG